jgi:flagellar motor switch protein FliM
MLKAFSEYVREGLSELFRTRLNRRYHADFLVEEVVIDAAGKIAPAGRWLAYGKPFGKIACAIDRSLVLCALSYRYGLKGGEGASAASPENVPETASEERLAARLGLQLVESLANAVVAEHESAIDAEIGDFSLIGPTSPPRSACLVRAVIRESTHGVEGRVLLALDDAWLDLLLRKLAPMQRKRSLANASFAPLSSRLHLKLVARLLQKDMPLGDLLSIKVGDVIPVSLRATEVLIDDSRLFTATVAEHKGKLCLTSFEDSK